MIEYKNILYCTDYSEDAEIALVHAVDLAQRHGATLHVLNTLKSLHRYDPGETSNGQSAGEVVMATPEILAKAAKHLKAHYASNFEEIGRVAYEVRVGTAFVEILRYAREHGIDLIVMGAAGDSELGPTHYGSTVDQVARRANCAVLAIRNPEKKYTL